MPPTAASTHRDDEDADPHFQPASNLPRPTSIATRNAHRLLFAAVPGNADVLRVAVRHVGASGRCDLGWKAVGPIPGNVIFIGVMDIARWSPRRVCQGSAIGRPVIVEAIVRPEDSQIIVVPTAMPQRLGDRVAGHRMHRMRRSMRGHSRPGEALAGGEHQRDGAGRCDKRAIHSMRHDTYHSLVTEQHPNGRLKRALRASKYIINGWLRRNLNDAPSASADRHAVNLAQIGGAAIRGGDRRRAHRRGRTASGRRRARGLRRCLRYFPR